MNRILAVVAVLGSLFSGSVCGAQLDPGPVLSGTINVIAANEQGIVVLTDSMLSRKTPNGQGGWTYKQVPDLGQKLFQLDNRTVCTFAGFASVKTPPVPDFLNNVSAIVGRYKGRLHSPESATVEEKLSLLEAIFSYYLRGTAQMLNVVGSESDYYVELLIAGYDPDGTPRVGSVILQMQPAGAQNVSVSLFDTVTPEFKVVPIARQTTAVMEGMIPLAAGGVVVVHGQPKLALEILQQPADWASDPAIAAYADSRTKGKPLTVEQMKALAISLKKHTSEKEPTVGGPNQIAVLTGGLVRSVEQPPFPTITATAYKFDIVETLALEDRELRPLGRAGDAVAAPGKFTLFFKNSFKRVQQHLDGAYFAGNVFTECRLIYSGGRLQFEDSNQVSDSDLILGYGVDRNDPKVKHLLNDFKWRHVEGLAEASRTR